MEDSLWHGWKMEGDEWALHVGELPGRKSVAVYRQRLNAENETEIDVLGYFRDAADAEWFRDWIDRLEDRVNRAARVLAGKE